MLDIGFDIYPIMILIGVSIALIIMSSYLKRDDIDKKTITDIQLALVISVFFGIISAVLFENLYEFIEHPNTYSWTWGMTFLGGLIGGCALFFTLYFVWLRKKHPPFLSKLMTIAAGLVPLAHFFGRIGCVLDGCCYGIPTDKWYGIKFITTDTKVIPTNLFEAIFLLILATVLLILAYKTKIKALFPIYMISYSIFRFLIEFLRNDDRGALVPGLSPSQFWCILMFIGGVVYLTITLIKANKSKQIQSK